MALMSRRTVGACSAATRQLTHIWGAVMRCAIRMRFSGLQGRVTGGPCGGEWQRMTGDGCRQLLGDVLNEPVH